MRSAWLLGIGLLTVMLAWSRPMAAPAKAILIEGTGVELLPGPGYLRAEAFPGLVNKELGAEVRIATVATPSAKAIAACTREQFAAWGMTLTGAQPVAFGAAAGQLFTAAQQFNGVAWRRVLGVFGDDRRTIQVVGSMTDENARKAGAWDALTAVVMSARFTTTADPFADTNFTLKEVAPLKFAQRQGATLLYTDTGSTGELPKTLTYTVTTVMTNNPIANLADFAHTCLDNAPQITQGNVMHEQEVTLDGLRGYQLGATAIYKNTAKTCLYFQVVLADKGCYYLVQGFVPATLDPMTGVRAEDLAKLKAFTTTTASFKRKTAR